MKQTTPACSLPLVILLILALGGCSDAPLDPGTTVTPGVGSWYAYSKVETDSSYKRKAGSETADTLVMISTGNTYKGRSDLHLLNALNRSLYLGYQSGADLMSIPGRKCNCWESWIRYPIATRKGGLLGTRDTVIGPQNGRLHSLAIEEIAYDGTASVTVPAGTFETHKMTETFTHTVRNLVDGRSYTQVTLATSWYAPTIGFMVKTVTRVEIIDNRLSRVVEASGSEEVLTAYEVR